MISRPRHLTPTLQRNSPAQKGRGTVTPWRMQVTLKPVPVILILLMLISGRRWLYLEHTGPDQLDSGAACAVAAASDGTIALLSPPDVKTATARLHLAGDFCPTSYDQFMADRGPKYNRSHRNHRQGARGRVGATSGFGRRSWFCRPEHYSGRDSPNPSDGGQQRDGDPAVDGNWLITKFTPV